MTKKDIKLFFKAVADGDVNKVSELLDNNTEYLTICNVAPPKKDNGQSGLQVAFKTGLTRNKKAKFYPIRCCSTFQRKLAAIIQRILQKLTTVLFPHEGLWRVRSTFLMCVC